MPSSGYIHAWDKTASLASVAMLVRNACIPFLFRPATLAGQHVTSCHE